MLVFRNCSMADLADKLASRPFKLDLPVLDRTGLEGRFDFALKLASNDNELKHTLEGMEQGPSIFVSLQEQLGLKLESRKSPIDVLGNRLRRKNPHRKLARYGHQHPRTPQPPCNIITFPTHSPNPSRLRHVIS